APHASPSTATIVTYPSPYSVNTHYSSHLQNLQTALGCAIPFVTSLDGYSLIDSARSRAYGPDTSHSGATASLWYSTPGTPTSSLESELSVNVATPGPSASGWGNVYRALLGSTTPTLVGPGYAAAKIGDNQAVFQRG